ncbi:transmembrane protein 14C-like protein [Rozella allomycis CSF55]|uniref:Transmembrane protein 14C-like protein n=1 Tax=Rozella allomycis (strain CSF55) TaxID=988480 RepID=A0A075AY21_ROZAC|nr:UPF0136 and Transmembrane domain-containing protein [Rozella allomycis CSF55]RKP17512.1 transmembrane protein 14C-like protein [Rozella allomycis CSF55]|eukprot:EPZ35147.1 UPF0136 and Transmembrane domain-containing protein [Rozella allomycis CSF55]
MNDIVSYVYSITCLLGGLIGFIKAGSYTSLLFGSGLGIVLFYGAICVNSNPKDYMLLISVSFLMFVVMFYRYLISRKFMPAGFICLFSAGVLLKYGARFVQDGRLN